MALTEIAPILMALAFVAYLLTTLSGKTPSLWVMPALLSAAFLLWSVATIRVEGPLGFWENHTTDLWGNQVWFDLLFAVAIGWTLILPRAQAQGMRLLPWLVAVCATGCVGLLAMLARLFYLEDRAARS